MKKLTKKQLAEKRKADKEFEKKHCMTRRQHALMVKCLGENGDVDIDWLEKGMRARERGKKISECPRKKYTKEWYSWGCGWSEQDDYERLDPDIQEDIDRIAEKDD